MEDLKSLKKFCHHLDDLIASSCYRLSVTTMLDAPT